MTEFRRSNDERVANDRQLPAPPDSNGESFLTKPSDFGVFVQCARLADGTPGAGAADGANNENGARQGR